MKHRKKLPKVAYRESEERNKTYLQQINNQRERIQLPKHKKNTQATNITDLTNSQTTEK